jgi:hypothetical protein
VPYNPGSAYPRKTIYVPPTYGDTSFQRAVNAPDVSSKSSFGVGPVKGRGRAAYAEAASAARGASAIGDQATGLAFMDRTGIGTKLQNRYNEQKGLKQNQGGATRPPEVSTPAQRATTHGNAAAMQKRAAAVQLSDEMVEQELTGALPGFTGAANAKKSRKKTNPDQQTLF